MIMLSHNFSLKELTASQTALRLGLDNSPEPVHLVALSALCHCVLQPIRDHFKRPVVVSSGLRLPAVSQAIGSSENSQHCKGEAADFEVPGVSNLEVAEWILHNLDFDQLILEGLTNSASNPNDGWIHCSYSRFEGQRMQTLRTYDFKTYLPGLTD